MKYLLMILLSSFVFMNANATGFGSEDDCEDPTTTGGGEPTVTTDYDDCNVYVTTCYPANDCDEGGCTTETYPNGDCIDNPYTTTDADYTNECGEECTVTTVHHTYPVYDESPVTTCSPFDPNTCMSQFDFDDMTNMDNLENQDHHVDIQLPGVGMGNTIIGEDTYTWQPGTTTTGWTYITATTKYKISKTAVGMTISPLGYIFDFNFLQFTTLSTDLTNNNQLVNAVWTWSNNSAGSSWIVSNNSSDAQGVTMVTGTIHFTMKTLPTIVVCPLCPLLSSDGTVNRKSYATPK